MSARQPDQNTQVVMIELESITLALPQSNLHTVESVLDIRRVNQGSCVGEIELRGNAWPVFSPDAQLNGASEIAPTRRICAMLMRQDGLFGVMCQEVTSVAVSEVRPHKLPRCMYRPDSPLKGLGMWRGRVVNLTTAMALYPLLSAGWKIADAMPASDEAIGETEQML